MCMLRVYVRVLPHCPCTCCAAHSPFFQGEGRCMRRSSRYKLRPDEARKTGEIIQVNTRRAIKPPPVSKTHALGGHTGPPRGHTAPARRGDPECIRAARRESARDHHGDSIPECDSTFRIVARSRQTTTYCSNTCCGYQMPHWTFELSWLKANYIADSAACEREGGHAH